MKRIFSLILVCMMTFSLAGCSAGESRAAESSAAAENGTVAGNGLAAGTSELPAGSGGQETAGEASADTLVIYFSCTGNTKAAAEEIQRQTGADIFEIVPEIPYTAEDLNYNDDNSRANQEQSDDSARPAISGSIDNFDLCHPRGGAGGQRPRRPARRRYLGHCGLAGRSAPVTRRLYAMTMGTRERWKRQCSTQSWEIQN